MYFKFLFKKKSTWVCIAIVLLVIGYSGYVYYDDLRSSTFSAPSSLYSQSASNVKQEEPTKLVYKDVELVDAAWCINNGKWLYYYATLHNPNTKYAVESQFVRVTARDVNNNLIGTCDNAIDRIDPNQDYTFATRGFEVDEIPAKVNIELISIDENDLRNSQTLKPYSPLEIINSTLRSKNIVGEIQNSNNYNINVASIDALFLDSENHILYMETGSVYNLTANSTSPFSIRTYFDGEYDRIICFANPWWTGQD